MSLVMLDVEEAKFDAASVISAEKMRLPSPNAVVSIKVENDPATQVGVSMDTPSTLILTMEPLSLQNPETANVGPSLERLIYVPEIGTVSATAGGVVSTMSEEEQPERVALPAASTLLTT